MTTSRHADPPDMGDSPVEGSDLNRGAQEAALARDARANGDRAGETPHESQALAEEIHLVSNVAPYQQPKYEGPVREIINFVRPVLNDKQAQDGFDHVLRSFSRNILLPVFDRVIVAIFLLIAPIAIAATIPDAPLCMRIGASMGVTAIIGVGIRLLTRRKWYRRRRGGVTRSSADDDPVLPEDNDSAC